MSSSDNVDKLAASVDRMDVSAASDANKKDVSIPLIFEISSSNRLSQK